MKQEITRRLPCGAIIEASIPIGKCIHVNVSSAWAGFYDLGDGRFKLVISPGNLLTLKEIIDYFVAQQPPKKTFWQKLKRFWID